MKEYGGEIVSFSTSITVYDINADIECNKCDKRVPTALLLYSVTDYFILPLFNCYDCVKMASKDPKHQYIHIDYNTEYKLLDRLRVDGFELGLESHARFFEYWNKNPRLLIHTICPRLTRVCNGCGKGGAEKICGKCQIAPYCNAVCQRADWGKHRVMCKETEEIFHIRSARFAPGVKTRRFKSNNMVLKHTEPCARCNHILDQQSVTICFFKGFVQRIATCSYCNNAVRRFTGTEMVAFIPFATTDEEFVSKLKEVVTKSNKKVWIV
jgi:hypothetical protein